MARATKIYCLYDYSDFERYPEFVGSFTVKHELITYIKKGSSIISDGYQVISVQDGKPDWEHLDITNHIKELVNEI